MITNIASIIAQQLGSKAIVDEVKIPYSYYNKFSPLNKTIIDIATMGAEIDPDNPFTLLVAGNKIISKFVGPPDALESSDAVEKYIDDKLDNEEWESLAEYRGSNVLMGKLIRDVMSKNIDNMTRLINSDKFQLMKFEYKKGKHIYFFGHADKVLVFDEEGESIEEENNSHRFFNMYFDEGDHHGVFEYMMSYIWKKDCLIMRVGSEQGYSFDHYEPSSREYIGDIDYYINSIKKFMDKKIKRTILFQGVPGTGKTTLCASIHRRISNKTLYIDVQSLKVIPSYDWFFIMDYAKPTVVVIEDIDRDFHALSLNMIEDPAYKVPLTLFNTNAQSNLPMAYRRPGRVDQIIKISPPSDDQLWMNVQKFAEMEKIPLDEVTDEAKNKLCAVMKSHSEAHLVELLRRYYVEGWDYVIPNNDISFGETMGRDRMEELTHITGEQI